MTHLGLIQAIADQMEAEGWQERSDAERCAEAAKRYANVIAGRAAPPWAAPRAKVTHARLRTDGQYEMVFGG